MLWRVVKFWLWHPLCHVFCFFNVNAFINNFDFLLFATLFGYVCICPFVIGYPFMLYQHMLNKCFAYFLALILLLFLLLFLYFWPLHSISRSDIFRSQGSFYCLLVLLLYEQRREGRGNNMCLALLWRFVWGHKLCCKRLQTIADYVLLCLAMFCHHTFWFCHLCHAGCFFIVAAFRWDFSCYDGKGIKLRILFFAFSVGIYKVN